MLKAVWKSKYSGSSKSQCLLELPPGPPKKYVLDDVGEDTI